MKSLQLSLGLICTIVLLGAQAAFTASHLRCEYCENPLGLETTQPRFGWQLIFDPRAEFQTIYEALAASSAAKRAHGDADICDGGEIVFGDSVHEVYAGQPCELSVVFCNRLNDVLRNKWEEKASDPVTSLAFCWAIESGRAWDARND